MKNTNKGGRYDFSGGDRRFGSGTRALKVLELWRGRSGAGGSDSVRMIIEREFGSFLFFCLFCCWEFFCYFGYILFGRYWAGPITLLFCHLY